MTSALERLAGPGKSLSAEPFDSCEFEGLVHSALARLKDAKNTALYLGEYEGTLDIDKRLVADLIAACETVANQLSALGEH